MNEGYRETTIRVHGVERIIRTELAGAVKTVKQLEAAHAKAVKAAITDARQAKLDARYADLVADAQKPQEDTAGFPGAGERHRERALAEAGEWRRVYGTAKPLKSPTCNYVDARKGFPSVRFTDKPSDKFLIQVAPGEYVSRELLETVYAPAAALAVGDRWLRWGDKTLAVWTVVAREGDTVTARSMAGDVKSQAIPADTRVNLLAA